MTDTARIDELTSALATALADLPSAEQRRRLRRLLEALDGQAANSDEFAATLLALDTDIRQRVALGQW